MWQYFQYIFAFTKYQYPMIKYNSVNMELYNSQVYKLKSTSKNANEVTVKPSSNMINNYNDETIFPYKLL